MSKYSKIMTMKNGGKMEIKTASVGLFAKLVSRLPAYQTGLRKNVDMVGISTDAIRKGAAKKAFPERFEKASKAYQQGNKEMLTGMKLRGPDLDLPKGVIVFSGFTYDEIRENKIREKCCNYIDVLIDGRYEDKNRVVDCFKGSSNQNIIYFSSKIKEEELIMDQEVEVSLVDNVISVTGFPSIDKKFLMEFGIKVK